MRSTTFLHVARDAWWLLTPLLAICVLLALTHDSVWPLVFGAIPAISLAMMAHDSDRVVPPVPLGLVAPVDGKVIHRRECHDPYLDRAAIKLSIRVTRLGVYYLRAPTEGTVLEVRCTRRCRHAGQASWIQTDEGDDVIIVVSSGSLLGQRPCGADFGQRIGQGRRCGPRRFARVIDVYIPCNTRVDVELGQIVRAGSDVLATMVHNASKLETTSA